MVLDAKFTQTGDTFPAAAKGTAMQFVEPTAYPSPFMLETGHSADNGGSLSSWFGRPSAGPRANARSRA